jgi:hypothetical protein
MKSKIENKKSIAVMVIIVVTALMLAGPWDIVVGDEDEGLPHVKPCGVYTGKDPGGATWNQTLIPCDPACNRMTAVVKYANISPVGPGFPLFPTTEFRTDLVGNLVRTGPNTWDFTWIGYGVEKPPPDQAPNLYAWPLTYIIVMSGTQTFTNNGDLATYNIAMGIWVPEDDVNPVDGVPDEGVEPFFSTPNYPEPVFAVTGTRLPVVPR